MDKTNIDIYNIDNINKKDKIDTAKPKSKKNSILSDYIDKSNGIFLLILAICGNFLAETINCKIQYELTNNRILKYVVVYFTIYFTITITSEKNENPFDLLLKAFLIWIFFILFTRMSHLPTLLVMILLLIIYFTNNYRTYLKNKKNKSKSISSKLLLSFQKVLLIAIIIIIFIGNINYFLLKKNKYGKDFTILKYIFGIQKCTSLGN